MIAAESPGRHAKVTLTISGLSRRFGQREVFSNLDITASDGQALVIAGPNGSGKSTLLRIIAGLLSPTSGAARLSIDGASLGAVERRRHLGYAAPDLVLYPELTGAENLLFFGRVRGLALERSNLVELLDRVGLRGRGRDLVGSYSSGMRQRLKYAFALLHRPPILLLDEPTANLDQSGVEMARSIVSDYRARGLVVMATNEEQEVGWGDAVVRLSAS